MFDRMTRAHMRARIEFRNEATGIREEGQTDKWLNHLMQHGWRTLERSPERAARWTFSRPEGGTVYEVGQHEAHFVSTFLDRFGPNYSEPLAVHDLARA